LLNLTQNCLFILFNENEIQRERQNKAILSFYYESDIQLQVATAMRNIVKSEDKSFCNQKLALQAVRDFIGYGNQWALVCLPL
jgi:hypothetical protein